MKERTRLFLQLILALIFSLPSVRCDCGNSDSAGDADSDRDADNDSDTTIYPPCPDGIDEDGDGYGDGCPAGEDCDDTVRRVNPAATEICNEIDDDCDGLTDEDVLTECGNCNPLCTTEVIGDAPFPLPHEDPAVETDGTGRNPDGDIVLDETAIEYNFLWIANTDDEHIGTVSKIDTDTVTEVARYFSVTCFGNPSWEVGSCESVPNEGMASEIQQSSNSPSRTAVDMNFDVWVANRAFGGQPSVTKIANSQTDCIDRNGNGVIDTSQDINEDGHITVDCDGDSDPDGALTICTDGLPQPEFLGWDDECVLMTVNFAEHNQLGRSVCLDAGSLDSFGVGNVWVGTNQPGSTGLDHNRFFHIDGSTGAIIQTVELPSGHNPYGCAVDEQGILWSVSQAGEPEYRGRLVYFDTNLPEDRMGTVLQPDMDSSHAFYGISLDSDNNIWMGGWGTSNVYRYRPSRDSFDTLGDGTWTRVRTNELGIVASVAGIAADLRGYIWAAANNGCILRIPQSIADGDHPGSIADWYAPGAGLTCNFGNAMRGVGVDFDGNLWGISHDTSTATRMDVDALGNPTGDWFPLAVGTHPYTYSDFTGFGLRNFTRPRGTYTYLHEGCSISQETHWIRVEWTATIPDGTGLALRVRSGDTVSDLGAWFGLWDVSPAMLQEAPIGPIDPNPARLLQIQFELTSESQEDTPVLHDFRIVWECTELIG